MNTRKLKDTSFKYLVYAIAITIILIVVLMFGFLVKQVLPLFYSGSITTVGEISQPSLANFISDKGYLIDISSAGKVKISSKKTTKTLSLDTKFSKIIPDKKNNFLAISGNLAMVYHFDDDTLEITKVYQRAIPKFENIYFTQSPDYTSILLQNGDNFSLFSTAKFINIFTGEETAEETTSNFKVSNVKSALFANTGEIYLLTKHSLVVANPDILPTLNEYHLIDTEINFSANFDYGNSLLIADKNTIYQFLINNDSVVLAKTFPFKNTILDLQTAHKARNFLVLDDKNNLTFINATSSKTSINEKNIGANRIVSYSENSGLLLTDTPDGQKIYHMDIYHMDFSVSSLFTKQLYEGYDKPEYLWQSTGNDGYESKFSLFPLVFGTMKATLYSLIIAIPLSIFAAIYVGFFMHHKLRNKIKPAIELLAAVPTVVIGMLASLMLAPLLENSLLLIILALIFVPLVSVGFGAVYDVVADNYFSQNKFLKRDLQFILLIIVLVVLYLILDDVAFLLEKVWFDGNFLNFLTENLGITYNQKNTLIVGLAMGIAIVPTIFTIIDDALYSVPSNLILGSYALGANRIITFFQVILPIITPAIFAGIIMGTGRAVGETMIVLMTSGNTAMMDWDIFSGLRALSANIAIEMPEAETGSTHYRILFLSGLLLFVFTFVINLIAELIRQNLKKKYALL